ncbi:efflux RND transporter permease subunit [Henriciella barbarensis]|uniref:Efflux RND transporter permease subunit n=1 Tax=Henriciella barbarensis TaxID=86342 RepID=A0A399QWI8_9PROT|nr:efflux RND transporter permease subunit [Henriciella barbarensis]RIJ22475.1 efflux RND transporter permease subunit [Henriciella barbarensis]
MITQTVKASLTHRLFILIAAAGLLVWGAIEAMRMPVDVFPDLTAPTVTVVAEAHGMAPGEVETLITFPVETALNGASGVRRVRSSTSVGSAIVWVDFEWGTDIYRARQIVSEKLSLVQESLPPDVPPPVLAPVSSIMGEIMFIALKSDQHDAMELKTAADWTLRRRLLAVPGVAQVIPIGGDTKQYQVTVDPERLSAYGLTLEHVTDAVSTTNENSSAGFVDQGGQEYLITGLGRAESVDDIAATSIAVRDGVSLMVRDVASVEIGPALKRGTGSHNGEDAVVLGIQKQPDTNTLTLTEEIDRVIRETEDSLPDGMRIETNTFRQSNFISVAVENVAHALRDGAILVIVIVFAFLMSWRATLISLLAIPLSLVVTILILQAMGASINTMTLGGMAIALGALVDDAIIVVENVTRRLRENKANGEPRSVLSVVADATREIQGSIVFATLIIMLVFLPLFFLSGVEGRLLQPLGLAYVIALAASLLVAVTVTPALSAILMPKDGGVKAAHDPWLSRASKKAYAPILDGTIKRWKLLSALSIGGLIAAIALLAMAGRSFLPDFNEGSLTVSAVTLPGTSLAQSDELGQLVEQIILEQPEVVSTVRRTGRAELDEHAQAVSASEIEVALRMGERSKEAFLEDLRASFIAVPGMNITIGQPISHRIDHMLSGTRANIAVKLFGEDLYELRRQAETIRASMEGVPGIVDLSVEQQADVPMLTVDIERQAIGQFGLTTGEVSEMIEAAFAGSEVSRVLEGSAAFDLVVRYDQNAKANLDAVRNTRFVTPTGAEVPLKALADIRRDRGPNTISRENGARKIVIMANVAGRDLLSTVNEIRDNIEADVDLPPGYYVEYGGQFESANAATSRLTVLSIAVIIGVFLLLYMAFNSARDATLVMINLPLALIGGVAGVYLSGGVLSVASIIGFITLFGIATRNGVMMVAHIRYLVDTGEAPDLLSAVRQGAMERLVPILMTALATALALVPLALRAGEPGSEIQSPMAMVILCGLTTSTILNMIVLPALYARFGERTARAERVDESATVPQAT